MNKAMCLIGAGFILVGMAAPVEARVLRYWINGKAYLYDTGDPQQVERASQRIAAAKAAYAARVRADAELASNPIVNVLGSPAQKEAAAARARFEQVLSEEGRPPAAASAARGERPTSRKIARANSVRRLSTVKTTPNRDIARDKTQLALNAGPDGPRPIGEPPSEAPLAREVTLNPAPTWTNLQAAPKPSLKSITFDLSSGIKSVQMTDGTVHEEPLDSSIVAKLGQLEPAAGSLNAFLEQVRGTRPLDITVTATPSSSSSTNQPE